MISSIVAHNKMYCSFSCALETYKAKVNAAGDTF